jgi:hypothetical protein
MNGAANANNHRANHAGFMTPLLSHPVRLLYPFRRAAHGETGAASRSGISVGPRACGLRRKIRNRIASRGPICPGTKDFRACELHHVRFASLAR